MGDSYTETANVVTDIIRSLFAFLDRPAYWLLGIVYQLFFNVASANLFGNNTIMRFYGRVQLIIGVFMMFQLAMTILKGIMNPDSFTDSKTGAGNLIVRIMVSLIMLTLMVPINISSPKNEYEKQINNNGLLFGTLYSLQHRILSNNTLGRLILGADANTGNYVSSNGNSSEELKTMSRIFTSTILKGFYRINLLPEDERPRHEDGKDDAIFNDNRVCKDIDDDLLAAYTKVDADPGEIISMVNLTCDSDGSDLGVFRRVISSVSSKLSGKNYYVFAYTGLISAIVAFIFVFILLSFTVDVAVRAVKLAVLRLLAPIPIISYMDPKGSKDSAFNSWVKVLTSTYLDLFIRLAVVYFVIFLIQSMIVNGFVINESSGSVGIISLIILWIGLFVFAKQAPKFIRQILGLKDEGGKLFGGLGEALAIGAVGAGVVGGAVSRGVATGAAKNGNTGKKILAGIGGGLVGGISGGYSAGKTLWNSKDFDSKAVMNQVRANNARNYSNAADESTPFGRFMAGMQSNIGLRNQLQQMDDKIKYFGAAEAAMKRITNAFDGNGDYKYTYAGADILDSRGNKVLESGKSYSLKDYKDIYNRVQSSGDNTLIQSVDDAMKKAQGARLTELRSLSRSEIEARVSSTDARWKDWTNNDLVAYDAAKTIYDVAQKYKDESFFARFKDSAGAQMEFTDPNLDWGKVFKHEAGQAGKAAEQIKNSNEYAQAKANAQRAADSQKK